MKDLTEIIGRRVKISGKHPWSGERGIVKALQDTNIGKVGYLVELDNGTSCFVFSITQLKILKS